MDETRVNTDTGKREEPQKKSYLARCFPWLMGLGLVGIFSVIGAIVLFILFAIFLAIMI